MGDAFYSTLTDGSFIGMFCQVIPITCLVGIVYVIFRCAKIRKQETHPLWGGEIFRALFVCYLTGLFNLVLVPRNFWLAIWFHLFNGYSGVEIGTPFTFDFNFVPTPLKWLRDELTPGSWVLEMLAGNLLMYAPMGFFLPFVLQKGNKRSIFKFAIAIPLIVESMQPIMGRSFDVDDLFCNFIGIIIGYCVAEIIIYLNAPHSF